MGLRTVTNNKQVYEYCQNGGLDCVLVEGGVKEALFLSRDLLMNGWRLAVDPLAGYLSRPNPYHTLFLRDNPQEEVAGDDVLRIEDALIQWHRYTNIIPMTPRLDADYIELDFSLAINSIDGLLRTPTYFSCA